MKILVAFFLLHIFFINTNAMMEEDNCEITESDSKEAMTAFTAQDGNIYITNKDGSHIRRAEVVMSAPAINLCLLKITPETPITAPIFNTDITVRNIMSRIINLCRSIEKDKVKKGSGYFNMNAPIKIGLILKGEFKHEVEISFDLNKIFSQIDIYPDCNINSPEYDKLREYAEAAVQAYEAREK